MESGAPDPARRPRPADPLLAIERRIGLLRSRSDYLRGRLQVLEDEVRRFAIEIDAAGRTVTVRTDDLTVTSDDPHVVEALSSTFGPLAPGEHRRPGSV